MASPSDASLRESTSTAAKFLSAPNLHRRLWLPECASHERLRITFSTTSNFGDESLPAVLFISGMFGPRYSTLLYDRVAQDVGVRVICIDRPGIGGSSPVPLERRVDIWLETVQAVLDKLNIKHVSLVSHSAGTIYSLNTLYRLRGILDPEAPFVAYLGPWVHSEHSKVALLNMVSKLPESLITSWHSINKFIATKVMPIGSWSGGIITAVGAMFQAEASSSSVDAARTYGVDEATAKEIEKLRTKCLFAEQTAGIDQEALLCLKKSGPGLWGVCEDYQRYVQDFVRMEKARNDGDAAAARIKVRMYYAESDILIGKGGARYFDRIWNQDGVSDRVDVKSKVMPGTDHDSVFVDIQNGAIRQVFEEIRSIAK